MANKRVDNQLAAMNEVLCQMLAATLRQPDISVVVKNGVERLDNFLDITTAMTYHIFVVSQRSGSEANGG